jgi:hypothetical protein
VTGVSGLAISVALLIKEFYLAFLVKPDLSFVNGLARQFVSLDRQFVETNVIYGYVFNNQSKTAKSCSILIKIDNVTNDYENLEWFNGDVTPLAEKGLPALMQTNISQLNKGLTLIAATPPSQNEGFLLSTAAGLKEAHRLERNIQYTAHVQVIGENLSKQEWTFVFSIESEFRVNFSPAQKVKH